MNFTTQCGENRHTDIANFATLIHTKIIIINNNKNKNNFIILCGNYYSPHGEFKLICVGKFARRTWVNFTQQYGKNRQRCQQNKFYYAVWQFLLYYYREFLSTILSVQLFMKIGRFSGWTHIQYINRFEKKNYSKILFITYYSVIRYNQMKSCRLWKVPKYKENGHANFLYAISVRLLCSHDFTFFSNFTFERE